MTRLPYAPALDGLRGCAVAGVLLFHAGVPWAAGGHLGVTVFFALSGFLITSLLLSEHEGTGRVDLRHFWARRAKRLVPALLVALGLVAAVAAASDNPADGILGDSVAALTWSSNWWFLHQGSSYADLFSDPSPLQHTWSLAVEEQYYLLFPLLLLVAMRRGRRALAAVLATLTVASVATSALLSQHGAGSSRLHYGTDTRVSEILVGALLAVLLQQGQGWRRLPGLTVPAGLAGAALLTAMVVADDDSRFLQRGGWALMALAACVVLAAAVQPGSTVARALGVPPLVWLGQVSYGAYLYHWPLFLLIDERTTGLGGVPLLALRLVSVLALAEISLRVLELPVRTFAFDPAFGVTSWALGAATGLVVVALATGAITLPTPPAPPDYAQAAAPVAPRQQQLQQQALPQQRSAPRQVLPQQQEAAPERPVSRAPVRKRATVPAAFAQDPRTIPVPPVPAARPDQLRVVVVGDSLGGNLAKGLQAWAQERDDVVVYDLAVPGCPLSRGGERRFYAGQVFPIYKTCAWWDDPGTERRRAFDRFAPQLVVAEDGVNELFDRRLPSWSDWRAPGDIQYDNWLVDEYTAAFQGQKVLLVNTPCADWDRYDAFEQVDNIELRVGAVNTDQSRLATVTRADLMSRICPNGRYRDEVEGVPDGRPDGLHLSDLAAARLARNWLGPLVLQTAKQPALLPTR